MNSDGGAGGKLSDRNILWLWPTRLLLFLFFIGAAIQGFGSAKRVGAFEDHSDVGATPKPGSAIYDSKRREYSVIGRGANMLGTADAFHCVWKRVSGAVTLSASVSLQGTEGNPHRKAGLMIRQGRGPREAYADALSHTDGLTSLQDREKDDSETLQVGAHTT